MKAGNVVKIAALLALTWLPGTSTALPGDEDQPIRIQSDTAELDEKQGVSIYRGRVTITQGSVKIRADKVTVESDNEGVKKIIAVGQPAHYEHKPKPDEPMVKARGEIIQYMATEDKVVILKNARLEQDHNVFQGDRINYDISKQLVKAHSKGTTKTGNTGKRVEIVIQPKKKE